MAYTGEVLRRAKLRLEQAKSDREAENAQHLRQAYAQVPRLAEIDRECFTHPLEKRQIRSLLTDGRTFFSKISRLS